MTRGERGALALAGAGAAALIGYAVLTGQGARAAVDVQLRADGGLPDSYGCPAHDIGGGPLHQRHGLFRRFNGHAARAAMTGGGWAWFLDPPADQGL